MICQYINNQFDTVLKRVDLDILEIIKNPIALPKLEMPHWLFVETSKPIRECTNYTTIHAFCFDYDGHMQIDEFAHKYKHLSYYLHTTSRHSKDIHRFRVILPLAESMPYIDYSHETFRKTAMEYFNIKDKSTFANFQKLPALSPDYYFTINEGEQFSINIPDFAELFKKYHSEKRIRDIVFALKPKAKTSIVTESSFNAFKAKVKRSIEIKLEDIPQCQYGSRYIDLTNLTVRLVKVQLQGRYIFTLNEVEDIILNHTNDKAIQKMIYSIFTKNR